MGINSQQMGYRLNYKESWFFGSSFSIDPSTGYVADINRPDEIQSTSHSSVVKADHIDVEGVGVIPYLVPDDFDEFGFYGAFFDYIAHNEGAKEDTRMPVSDDALRQAVTRQMVISKLLDAYGDHIYHPRI